MLSEKQQFHIASIVRRLSVTWRVTEDDLRSYFDDSVSLDVWQSLMRWYMDFPTMTLEASVALFEAKAFQRRCGRGRLTRTGGTNRTKLWQPWDISASRIEMEQVDRSVSLSPYVYSARVNTDLIQSDPLSAAELYEGRRIEGNTSTLLTEIRKCKGWKTFPSKLPAELHLEIVGEREKMQAFYCLAKRCCYQYAKPLLVAEHSETLDQNEPSMNSITAATIIGVAKMVTNGIRRNSSHDSETVISPNAALHETTTQDRPQSTKQIVNQADCTSQEHNSSSIPPCAKGTASTTSEAPIELSYDLLLTPQRSEPPSCTGDDTPAIIDGGNSLVSLRLDNLNDHARPWNYDPQSRSDTGLRTPPTSSPDIDHSQCGMIDGESNCIDLTARVPKEVTYSEEALLRAISNTRKSVARLDLKVRQGYEILAEFVDRVLDEGPIDFTKAAIRSAIATCQTGFERRSPNVRGDLNLICDLVADIMNQEDVSIEWDVDDLDCSDDEGGLEDSSEANIEVVPTACDNKLRRKVYDMDDSVISIHEDQGTRPTKKRKVTDATHENISLANIDSGLDLLYQAVRKVELKQSLWEHGLG